MRVGVFLRARHYLTLFLGLLVVAGVIVLAVRLLHLILDGDRGHKPVLLRKARRCDIRQQPRDRLRI